jgi:cytosine/adenosine deaminase-related metal-dependent hydrolase
MFMGGSAPAAGKSKVDKLPHRNCIIEASWVLAYRDGRVALIPDGSIRVRDDRIVEVKAGRIAGRDRRINAKGQLLLPGFISGHTHACSATPTRGIIEGGRSYARPLELVETLSDGDLDALTAYNVAELLRSGCTTHVEMSLSLRQAESYVRVARRWKVRGYPGGMIPGIARLFPIWFRQQDQVLHDSVPETLKEIDANQRFALQHNGAEDGRLRPQLSPHATDTHTPETLRAILGAAKEVGNGIHIHLSQSAKETATVQRLWGKRPVEWLDALGFFSHNVFGAHMSGVDLTNDLPILAKRSFTYAHCPSGGGAGGSSGTQPYPEALAAGVRTSIGIDTHSNDYVENVKLAVLYGRARARVLNSLNQTPLPLPTIWQAIEGATLNAAVGLGRDDLGRIAPGAKADLCTIDVTGFLTGVGAPPPEPLNNLLYAHGLAVRHVMTDGYFQIFDGRLVVDDEDRVRRQGGAAVEEIWAQLHAEKWFDKT